MRPQSLEHAVVVLLRQCYIAPRCQATRSWRSLQLAQNALQPHRGLYPRLQQRREYHCKHSDESIESTKSVKTSDNGIDSTRLQANSSNLAPYDKESPTPPLQNAEDGYAILGGGITGLAAAYYMAKWKPNSDITIYEGSDRLGGWLSSERVEVDGGDIVFEQGPRTLRPNVTGTGITVLELIQDLGLQDQLLLTPKDSESAKNRYVYYPDRLIRMPGPGVGVLNSIWALCTDPALNWAPKALYHDFKTIPNRPASMEDESLNDFLERRLGTTAAADITVSAVLHGIYAGDIDQLSAKSIAPSMWNAEKKHGGMIMGMWNTMDGTGPPLPTDIVELYKEIKPKIDKPLFKLMKEDTSVYSFKDGIEALSRALEESLQNNPKVHVKTGYKVKSLDYDDKSLKVKISTTGEVGAIAYKKVISTLSGPNLASLIPTTTDETSLPSLAAIHSVTVMVVNLFFHSPDLLPVHGFGYLIPRAIPYEQNPECALGVVFDSDSVSGQDTVDGTKVTVMIGGHWWDHLNEYPDSEEGLAMARRILARHLGITDEPAASKVGLQKNCIPQYVVGHESRLAQAHHELMKACKGTVAVAGNSFGGVGLADCVKSARAVAKSIKEGDSDSTGLERYTVSQEWSTLDLRAERQQEHKERIEEIIRERQAKKTEREKRY